MAKIPLPEQQARAYLRIAHRQLAMAEALLEKDLYEGVIFHCYHAFEAVCSAGIAHRAWKIPLRHRIKFDTFRRLYPTMPFVAEFASLLAELYPKRERSLYADIEFGRVSDPTLTHSRKEAEDLLTRTRDMVTKIERLI